MAGPAWDDPERLGAHGRARLEFFAAIDRRERMQEWTVHDPAGTEAWFRRYLDRPRLPLCEELLEIVSEWRRIYKDLGASGSFGSVRVQILRWALHGRVKEFVEYAKASGSRFAPGALAAVDQVYNYRWPYGAVVGPMFGGMYGWLQIELEKPREMERLRRWEEHRRKNRQEEPEQEREPN